MSLKDLFSGSTAKQSAASPDDLLADFPRGIDGRHLKDTWLPQSYFEDADNVSKRVFYSERGDILLGTINGETTAQTARGGWPEYVTQGGTLVGYNDDRHLMTIAGSRAGKGRSTIIPNLYTYPGSVLIIDPKAESTITAKHRAEQLGHQVYILDPFEICHESAAAYRSTYNPIEAIGPENPMAVEDAGLLSRGLVASQAKGDPHWDDSARAIIEKLCLHVATDIEIGLNQRNLATVADMLNGRFGELTETIERLQSNDSFGGRVIAGGRMLEETPERERGSILSTVRRHLAWLDYPSMRTVTSGHEFDLAELKKGPVTLYLCLPALRLHSCRGWLRLLINQFLAAMEREHTKPQFPILAMLDEAAILGHMDELVTAAGLLAGLDVRLWTFFQDLNQAKGIYGDRWETFLGNCGMIQAFGNTDHFTLDHISKMLGQTTVTTTTRSSQSRDQIVRDGASGVAEQRQLQALLSPSESSQYFARDDRMCRQLVMLPGRRPYVLSRITHDKHEYFQKLDR